jgi:16S rRNA (adenine1518-N6/adenine1519-N6)-dimethyltransferase
MESPLFPGPPLNARRMLREAGLRPRKSLGQNFLIDENALDRVASAAEIGREDSVLEIGAGLGGLTRHLAARARRVIAVELDPLLVRQLRLTLAGFPNVLIVQGDILGLPIEELMEGTAPGHYKVAANIPYYITSAIIRRLVETKVSPERIVLTVQKEVADRICAPPGKMSLLSLSVQYYGTPLIVGGIPAESFYPVPKVDSAIVKLELRHPLRGEFAASNRLFRIARAGFSQKRKMLRNTISSGLGIPPQQASEFLLQAGVDPKRRAETLAVGEWIKLAESMGSIQPK